MDNCFSEQLNTLRREKHWTQKELAKKLKVSETTVSLWNTGKTVPSNKTIVKIAKTFGVPIESLIGTGVIQEEPETFDEFKALLKVRGFTFQDIIICLEEKTQDDHTKQKQ